jgi:hypothetical protein
MTAAAVSTGRRAAGGMTAAVVVVAAIAAGIGWLYVLRSTRALDAGPSFTDALPLQRLAGQGTQPLLRLALAWVPAGLVAALGLSALTGLRRAARTVVVAAIALVVLFAAGAGSDSVTASDPLGPHVAPQLSRPALWAAVALVACGALLAPVWRRP